MSDAERQQSLACFSLLLLSYYRVDILFSQVTQKKIAFSMNYFGDRCFYITNLLGFRFCSINLLSVEQRKDFDAI